MKDIREGRESKEEIPKILGRFCSWHDHFPLYTQVFKKHLWHSSYAMIIIINIIIIIYG